MSQGSIKFYCRRSHATPGDFMTQRCCIIIYVSFFFYFLHCKKLLLVLIYLNSNGAADLTIRGDLG